MRLLDSEVKDFHDEAMERIDVDEELPEPAQQAQRAVGKLCIGLVSIQLQTERNQSEVHAE